MVILFPIEIPRRPFSTKPVKFNSATFSRFVRLPKIDFLDYKLEPYRKLYHSYPPIQWFCIQISNLKFFLNRNMWKCWNFHWNCWIVGSSRFKEFLFQYGYGIRLIHENQHFIEYFNGYSWWKWKRLLTSTTVICENEGLRTHSHYSKGMKLHSK